MTKLRRWRTKSGLTTKGAAALLKMNQAAYWRLENDERTASLGMLLRIERLTHGAVRAEHIPMTSRTRVALVHLRRAMKGGDQNRSAETAA